MQRTGALLWPGGVLRGRGQVADLMEKCAPLSDIHLLHFYSRGETS